MRTISIIACLLACGCGPLTVPLVARIDEDTQQKVDQVWLTLFTPGDRIDRGLLLDVIVSEQLHQFGVDSLRMVSEKRIGDDLVVMEVRYERDDPQFDEFSVTYLDSNGREVRRERYSREDVEERIDFLTTPVVETDLDAQNMDPALRDAFEQRRAERDARLNAIREITAPLMQDDDLPAEQDEDG